MPCQPLSKLLLCLVGFGVFGAAASGQAGEMKGHRFGEWPAISAVIAEESQKNLNLDDKDFLIEIWFKPLATLKYKGGPELPHLQEMRRRPARLQPLLLRRQRSRWPFATAAGSWTTTPASPPTPV